MLWIAIGGIVGGRMGWLKRLENYRGFVALSLIVSLLLPITVLLIRAGRAWLVNPPGVSPPFIPSVVFSVIIVAPFCFLYGHLYNVLSRNLAEESYTMARSVSKVYIFEAIGSTIGAVVFSFLLIQILPQFLVSAIIALLLVCSVLLYPVVKRREYLFRLVMIVSFSVFVLIVIRGIDSNSMKKIFRGYRIEEIQFSRYGEIVLASHREVLSVFSQGARLFSVPEPERTEEVVHIPLLMHENPEDILMIGGGLGGGVEEAMKHQSIKSIECLELDRKVLNLRGRVNRWIESHDSSVARVDENRAGKVEISFIHADGRFFLKKSSREYDVIIVNAPPPINLQLNRFYTAEFFNEAKERLRRGGILSLSHPSSENFVSREQAETLAILYWTLKSVFKNVVVLPGDIAHFLASDDEMSVDDIFINLKSRNINTRYINLNFLPFRFAEERIKYITLVISQAGKVGLNHDHRPVATTYESVVEAKRQRVGGWHIFSYILRVKPLWLFIFSLIVLVGSYSVLRGSAVLRGGVFGVGFSSFILQIMILLQFQSFSGLLYHAFILLTAIFMVGASLGAYLFLIKNFETIKWLRRIHLFISVTALLVIGFTLLIENLSLPYWAGFSGFMVLSMFSGFLTGSYYPLVTSAGFSTSENVVPAEFYAWDLLGASAGGFVAGVLFFPIMGLIPSSIIIVLFNILLFYTIAKKVRV